MFKNILYVLLVCMAFAGCESKPEEAVQEPAVAPSKAELAETGLSLFLEDPTEAVVVETPTEGLSTWRKHSSAKPVLLLLANNPLLQTIPDVKRDQVMTLVSTGAPKDLRDKTLATTVAPVMLPNMALSAALDAALFSRVIWVLPLQPGSSVSLDAFRQKLLDLKDVTPGEAASFTADGNAFSGVIRGVPFRVVLKTENLELVEPVVMHLDLGFLGADYHNEIRTPLYNHAGNFLAWLKAQKLKVLAITICTSNLTDEVSLRTRFLADYIFSIIRNPALLGTQLKGNAALRNDAFYLGNFFRKEEVLELNREMVTANPQEAAAHYDLYLTLRQFNKIDEALEHLELAATLDLAYAMEYLELADVALAKNRPDGALRMLKKAATYFPDNPFLEIGQADILIHLGHAEQAKPIIEKLKQLPWSEVYHKDMPDYLDEMLTAAEQTKPAA